LSIIRRQPSCPATHHGNRIKPSKNQAETCAWFIIAWLGEFEIKRPLNPFLKALSPAASTRILREDAKKCIHALFAGKTPSKKALPQLISNSPSQAMINLVVS